MEKDSYFPVFLKEKIIIVYVKIYVEVWELKLNN